MDDFVQQLLLFPAEAEIISESVYANSQTMDGRQFAAEFLRRRKLVEKGIVQGAAGAGSAGTSTYNSSGVAAGSHGKGNESKNPSGWNEVAKKGSSATTQKDGEGQAAFKVVAAKKKGRR